MTISTSTNKVQHSGDGVTKTFAYNFKIFADSDLEVYIIDSDGTETLQSDYTVTGVGEATGGNVVFGTVTPSASESVLIRRIVDIVQETDYTPGDPFQADTHEDALDYQIMVDQQLNEEIGRTVKAPVGETGDLVELPSASLRASRYFIFDSNGAPDVSAVTVDQATDHGYLEGLGDDDHTHYILVSGTRPFLGTVGGVTPVADADLSTKGYVDNADSTISGVLQTQITTNANNISTADSKIDTTSGTLQAQITSNDADIATNVANIASNTASIAVVSGSLDTHEADSTIHFTEASIDHSGINDDEATKHRLINDSGTSLTELWSASKIDSTITAVSGSMDHGNLLGLSDDDHPQYSRTDGTRSITGAQAFLDNVTIAGDLTVSGTQFISQVETVEVSDNLILINAGETGAGVSLGEAGIEVDRGSETNYRFMFDEANDHFEVGISGTEQAVATREDSPTDTYVPYWNNAQSRFDTAGSSAYTDIASNTTYRTTHSPFWNGTIHESFDFRIVSGGATVTGTLEQSGGGDLTMHFSDGETTLDCTPAQTIVLTPGTDNNPQTNYVYITQAAKTLTHSTADWPSEEHIKVAEVVLSSASYVAAEGALRNQNWNDHIAGTDDQGHLSHIAQAIRHKIGATWMSGVAGTCTISGAETPDGVYFSTTAGVVMQMHHQTFTAKDTAAGDDIHIINDSVSPYKVVNGSVGNEQTDASGASLNNSSFSFVLWGVANKTGELSHLMLNLPTNSYNRLSPTQAVSDASNYSVYDIPAQFKGVGFLIARFTFQLLSDVWTLYDTEDLRGRDPAAIAGGGGGGSGVTDFLGLSDTPNAYTSEGLKGVRVASGETALEFVSIYTADEVDTISGSLQTGIDAVSGQGETGSYSIADGVDNFTVTFTTGFSGTSYDVVGTIVNETDANPSQYAWVITDQSSGQFDVKLSDTTDSANYKFNYRAGDIYSTGIGLQAGVDYGTILTNSGDYAGDIMTVVVSGSVSLGDVLYQEAAFQYTPADADSTSTSPAYVLAITAGAGTKPVLMRGQFCNNSWNWSAGKLYLSTTTGEMTQTKPSGTGDVIQVMGWALSADTIFFDPVTMVAEVE